MQLTDSVPVIDPLDVEVTVTMTKGQYIKVSQVLGSILWETLPLDHAAAARAFNALRGGDTVLTTAYKSPGTAFGASRVQLVGSLRY